MKTVNGRIYEDEDKVPELDFAVLVTVKDGAVNYEIVGVQGVEDIA